jgi:hypothetical protein
MQIVPKIKMVKIQKMIKKYRKSLANLVMYPLYTLFCIKIKNIFLFFLNPGTIGTIKKSIVYQRLYAQICTKGAWYNEVQLVQLLKKLVIPTK